jgi:hypothetical protein
MRLRPERILEDTTITLKDGTQFRTRYERDWHIVTCNLCSLVVKLPLTANPQPLESHLKACKARQEKRAARQEKRAAREFQTLDAVPEAERSFGLQLLFHMPTTSINSDRRTPVECPGQWVQWSAGSIWETYPFRLHKAKDIGWIPISIDESHNGLVVRAKKCWRKLEEFDSEDNPSPCFPCREVPRAAEFKAVVNRAENVKDHTPWIYLTDLQKEKAMRQMVVTIRRLRSQVCN